MFKNLQKMILKILIPMLLLLTSLG